MNLKSSLLLAAALCAAPFASAQLTLHNFSAFESPTDTFFVGDWALTDPNGDIAPISTFSQGAGFYNFAGGTNADTSGAFNFFSSSPGNLTGYTTLEISARLLPRNAAPTFTISLFDSLNESAFAVFSTADFATPGFTTISAALTFSPGFDPTNVASFLITGGVFGGTDALNLSIDNLAVNGGIILPVGAVPEPTTYGAFAGVALLALIFARRFLRRG